MIAAISLGDLVMKEPSESVSFEPQLQLSASLLHFPVASFSPLLVYRREKIGETFPSQFPMYDDDGT